MAATAHPSAGRRRHARGRSLRGADSAAVSVTQVVVAAAAIATTGSHRGVAATEQRTFFVSVFLFESQASG